jgi:ribosomal protein S18 acetylase RimI-like enzyme
MENELLIRGASVDDINTIGFLAQEVWPSTYKDILSPGQIDYMMNLFYSPGSLHQQMEKHSFLLAELDEEPVGFASFSPLEDPGLYKLHKIYVKTGIQGRGLGRALISYIIEEIKTSGATALDLNVNRSNKAKTFYEKLGFKVVREEDIDIGNGFWMIDYVMRLEINSFLESRAIVLEPGH